jgi:hypothetical protein
VLYHQPLDTTCIGPGRHLHRMDRNQQTTSQTPFGDWPHQHGPLSPNSRKGSLVPDMWVPSDKGPFTRASAAVTTSGIGEKTDHQQMRPPAAPRRAPLPPSPCLAHVADSADGATAGFAGSSQMNPVTGFDTDHRQPRKGLNYDDTTNKKWALSWPPVGMSTTRLAVDAKSATPPSEPSYPEPGNEALTPAAPLTDPTPRDWSGSDADLCRLVGGRAGPPGRHRLGEPSAK